LFHADPSAEGALAILRVGFGSMPSIFVWDTGHPWPDFQWKSLLRSLAMKAASFPGDGRACFVRWRETQAFGFALRLVTLFVSI
jgi:hypothetical protein